MASYRNELSNNLIQNISLSHTDSNTTYYSVKSKILSEEIIEETTSLKNSDQSIPSSKQKGNEIAPTDDIRESDSIQETPSKFSISSNNTSDSSVNKSVNLLCKTPKDFSPGGERALKLLNDIMKTLSGKKNFQKTPFRTPLARKNLNINSAPHNNRYTKVPRISGITCLRSSISSPEILTNKPISPIASSEFLERTFSTPNIGSCYDSHRSEKSDLPISNNLSSECLNRSNTDSDDDDVLPPTQICSQTGILKGVIAYVEVRFGADNRSWGVKGTLEDLGAAVFPKFNKNVTHVIFHEGLLSTYKKAVQRKVHLVSVIWIEECKKARKLVPESMYPPLDIHKYQHAELFKTIPRVKSIQPDFDNERPLKLTRKKIKMFKEMKEQLRIEREQLEKLKDKIEHENKNTVSPSKRRLETYKMFLDPKDHHLLTKSFTENIENSQEMGTPLAVRLWRKFNTPQENEKETMDISKENLHQPSNENNDEPQTSTSVIPPKKCGVRSNLFPLIPNKLENVQTSFKNLEKNPGNTSSNKKQELIQNRIDSLTNNLEEKLNFGQDSTIFTEEDLSLTTCAKGNTTYLSEAASSSDSSNSSVRKRKLFTQPRILSFEDLGSPPNSPVSLKIPSFDSIMHDPQEKELGPLPKRRCNKTNKTKKKPKTDKISKTDLNKNLRKPSNRQQIHTNRQLFPNRSLSSRGSSHLFIPQIQLSTSKSRSSSYLFQTDDFRNLRSISRTSLACTSLHREENLMVQQVINRLGGFTFEEAVTSRTSHLIVGRPRRTINVLKAMARGCWIVTFDWLIASHQQNCWVEEFDYELTEFSPAVRQCRLDRLSFGPTFRLSLFEFCGRIFVSPKSKPRRQDISELITLGGGILTKTTRNADFIVGPYEPSKNEIKIISEKWVLDSIMDNQLHDIKDYIL